MSGFRKHGRKMVRCAVKLNHRHMGEVLAETRDISESGVFVRGREFLDHISIGEKIDAQLFSDLNEVSKAQLRVIRMTEDGVGLAFD